MPNPAAVPLSLNAVPTRRSPAGASGTGAWRLARRLLTAALLAGAVSACSPASDAPQPSAGGSAASAAAGSAGTETIYHNGRIWLGGAGTAADDFAQAFLVEGDRIVAVGTDAELLQGAGPDVRRRDLQGRLVVPGFIDNHTHFVSSVLAMDGIDLRTAASREDFSARVAERAKQHPGQWILMGNWDHQLWGGTLPDRSWVDEAAQDAPVFVVRLDGHMGLANTAALKLAGITRDTPDPDGGEIIRDAQGEPTGMLKDTAMTLVMQHVPAPEWEQLEPAMTRGFQEALRHGVTQIHDMSDGEWSSLDAFQRYHEARKLPIRVYSFVPLAEWARLQRHVAEHGRGDDWLRWGALKGFVDGSLGSSTAWMHEPFSDDPGNRGLTMVDPGTLREQILGADAAGLHVTVHAIGDHANDWLLDRYEEAAKLNGERDRRFRVEHSQHLREEAMTRFHTLGVIASMQPYHAIDDGRWAETKLGAKRLAGTYAFRSLLDHGVALTFGSDWAVAPIDPITGIDAAVTRRTIDGRHPQGWQPQERISVAEALRAYTAENARAGFQDDRLGRIAPGMLADFVVLSQDLFQIRPEAIVDTRVLLTAIGGHEAYCDSEYCGSGADAAR